jgi:hypothetical protein
MSERIDKLLKIILFLITFVVIPVLTRIGSSP